MCSTQKSKNYNGTFAKASSYFFLSSMIVILDHCFSLANDAQPEEYVVKDTKIQS